MDIVFIVKHGLYEEKHISLVTNNIEKACKHLITYSQDGCYLHEINGIEVWKNEELLIDYGSLTIHLINNMSEEELNNNGWEKIKENLNNLILKVRNNERKNKK